MSICTLWTLCVQVVYVPLEKFVCSVETHCPQHCTCIKRPSNLTFSVICQAGTQDHLPDRLPDPDYPPPRIGKFQLNFSSSNIRTLECRRYLTKTVWIDVSNSNIHSISDEVWKVLSRIHHVDLSRNRITVLPTFLMSENITFRWLALHENPLHCRCKDKWIRGWLQSLGKRLFAPCYRSPVVCGSPYWSENRNILEMTDDDFCRDPNRDRMLLIVEVFEPLRYLTCYFCSFICCFLCCMRKLCQNV